MNQFIPRRTLIAALLLFAPDAQADVFITLPSLIAQAGIDSGQTSPGSGASSSSGSPESEMTNEVRARGYGQAGGQSALSSHTGAQGAGAVSGPSGGNGIAVKPPPPPPLPKISKAMRRSDPKRKLQTKSESLD